MPFASAALFTHMRKIAADYDVVVPTWPKPGKDRSRGATQRVVYEPLHALYSRRCLGPIEDALAAGERRVQSWFGKVRVREVSREEWRAVPGVGERIFENVNTPAQLQRLIEAARPGRED
jgi:molybdopterin-guanine dinucleotide biosynthesis protein A